MTINYQLTYLDFLEHQLYICSKSEQYKKGRFRTRIIVPIIYFLFGLYLAYNGNYGIGIVFAIIGVLWFVFYPLYSKWKYKNHFKKHIEENYKNRINKTVEIEFDKNSINAKDFTSESRMNRTELKQLIETKGHFFIKLTTDLSLIIPKQSIENQTKFKKVVMELGVEYLDELNWVWK